MSKKGTTRARVSAYASRKGRGLLAVYVLLSVFVLFTLLRSFFRGEYFNVFVCLLTLALFMIPAFVEKNFRVHLTSVFEGIVLVFIFSAEILGEINCYYQKVPHWDTVLHTVNGFMFAAFGFALWDMINRESKLKFRLSPIYLSLMAFCFSMTVGVFWEFFEFGCDMILHTDMQKDTYVSEIYTVLLDLEKTNTPIPVTDIGEVRLQSGEGTAVFPSYLDIGLIDTMKDLLVNFIGAAIFSIIGYFFVKSKGEGRFAGQFIPQLCEGKEGRSEIEEDGGSFS